MLVYCCAMKLLDKKQGQILQEPMSQEHLAPIRDGQKTFQNFVLNINGNFVRKMSLDKFITKSDREILEY